MAKADIFINALRQGNKRITDQRRIICEYLASTRTHPTAYQVYEALSTRYPEISRATVYNTLNTLKELGASVEIGFGDGSTHYDTDPTPHINLVCLRCLNIFDYKDEATASLHDLSDAIRSSTGFEPITTKIEILGFCRVCREEKRNEIRRMLDQPHHA